MDLRAFILTLAEPTIGGRLNKSIICKHLSEALDKKIVQILPKNAGF